MKNINKLICAAALAAFMVTPSLRAEDKPEKKPEAKPDAKAAAKPEEKPKAKAYPLKTCAVTGEKLDADPAMKTFAFVHEGQEIKLCCKSCKKKFDKEPASYLKKMNEAVAKEKAASKPEAPAKK
jgi:YHS domain-containing protein